MEKIYPGSLLTDVDPTDISSPNIGQWYKDESIEIWDPEATTIQWMRAQGWVGSTVRLEITELESGELRYSRVWGFTRRSIDSEKVLDDLVDEFVQAYNEGRSANDQRYDDIVLLYSASLDRTEDEFNDLEADETTYKDLVTTIVNTLASSFNTHDTDVNDTFDDYGDSETERINDQYDNLLASKEVDMRTRGLYNTTVWDAIETGIERERSDALTALNDKLKEREWTLKDRLYTLSLEVDKTIIDARGRIFDQIHRQDLSRTDIRNKVVDALARFAERRTDSYPGIGELNNLANSVGFGNPRAQIP